MFSTVEASFRQHDWDLLKRIAQAINASTTGSLTWDQLSHHLGMPVQNIQEGVYRRPYWWSSFGLFSN